MALSCGSSMIKYFLFAFNLLCTLLSIAVIAVGALLLVSIGDLCTSSDCNIQWFPLLLLIVGVTSFCISFFGCCGAIRESTCMIYTYSTFLFLLLLVHVVVGIWILIEMSDLVSTLKEEMQRLWNERGSQTIFWDVVQRGFQCCGLNGPGDWGSALPQSCCAENTVGTCSITNAFTPGCSLTTSDGLSFFGILLGWVALGTGVVQLVVFVFSCVLVNSVRRSRMGIV